jgi:small-conductance mechanosensitive channel
MRAMADVPTPSEADHISGALAALTSLVHGWVEALLGAGARNIAFGAVSWADLGVVLAFALCALAATGVAAALLRRRGPPPAGAAPPSLRHRILAAIGRPLYLLIWTCGLYVALMPLLLRLGPGEASRALYAFADTLLDLGVFGALFWGVSRLARVLDERLAEWAAKSESRLDQLACALLGKSLRVAIPVMGVIFALPILNLPVRYTGPVTTATSTLLIGALAVILFQAVGVFEDALLGRFDIKASDNLAARKVYTQVHVIGRLIRVVIGVFAASTVLMLFDSVRHIGTSLLASAGIVGIVAGIAAQRTLANLFAGFQIALTQPMRQDDVVTVEGEWGRIEEITLSYVVVHLWDDRRLVVPLSYFIEKPFQNWTRSSAQLLGSVLVWVDYSFPVEAGRAALKGIIEGNPLWDGRYWNLQVTDATERSMQLRVLATSADSSKSWDLRCQIREQFIGFIRDAHPRSLPLVRAHLQRGGDPV